MLATSGELGTLVEVLGPEQADKRSGAMDVELESSATNTTRTSESKSEDDAAVKDVITAEKVHMEPASDYENGECKDHKAAGEVGEDFIAYTHKGAQLEPKPPDERRNERKVKL